MTGIAANRLIRRPGSALPVAASALARGFALRAAARRAPARGRGSDQPGAAEQVGRNGRTASTPPSAGAADVRTSIPILSPQIVEALQQAIAQYSDIVARGGWPVVPADKKLKLGVRGPAVVDRSASA